MRRDNVSEWNVRRYRDQTVLEMAEKKTGEVGVHTLVTRDEFVREHKAGLLEPENRRLTAAKTTKRSPKLACLLEIQQKAQTALRSMQETVLTASKGSFGL